MDSIISERTFYAWCDANDEFQQKSSRARERQGFLLADRAMIESRTPRIGQVRKSGPKGDEITVSDNVERSKLIVQAYFKRAGQLNKALGDKMQVGGDKDNPLTVKIEREEVIGKLIGNRAAQAGPSVDEETRRAE
jgi:hypothetical protein